MEFRILGPLEVVDGERSIPLGGAKQRSLLALLLLARGRSVKTDTLIEEIWNGDAPETARKSVQAYVSGLRDVLGDTRIRTVDGGYALHVAQGELDADRLAELIQDVSAGGAATARDRLRWALGLVRGEPLEDLRHEHWAAREAAHLEELVLAARESAVEAELELGEHSRLVPELERLVAEHPYREHLLEQLMVALYRSGRRPRRSMPTRQHCTVRSFRSRLRAGGSRRSSSRSSIRPGARAEGRRVGAHRRAPPPLDARRHGRTVAAAAATAAISDARRDDTVE